MEGNIRGFSRYQVSGGKYKALVMVVPLSGEELDIDKDPGKEEKLYSSLWNFR